MELSPPALARLCGATIEGRAGPAAAEGPLEGISTDSREVIEGGAFVAVRGETDDGHAYVADAARRGARVAVVEDAWVAASGAPPLLLRVPDTARALRQACETRLRELGCTVIGVTGSVGKTTAKEMIAHLLGPDGVLRTAGNLNTWTGVPLSVLRADGRPAHFVAEMGMSAPGEIADLCEFTHPSVGVLLNIGVSHLELLGSRAAIAAAKAELLRALPATGLAVCNRDDEAVAAVVGQTEARVVWFGTTAAASYRAEVVEDLGLRGTRLHLTVPGGEAETLLPAPGRHLAAAAAAACAVAVELGRPLEQVAARLAGFSAVEQRGTVSRGARGATVIDDSYNSAPASLIAALDLLAATASTERVAVLGDMLELGAEADAAHDEAGRPAAAAATLLIAVGDHAPSLAAAAVRAGLPAERALVAADAEAAARLALAACSPHTTVLVKGSHSLHLERVVERLLR
ncbi:MAG TPA: UDP-N-acetylmuramoyl-tripeptide--D-alanyl-D-alanine ligase [Candidatus Dormibacteraeota bacterium]